MTILGTSYFGSIDLEQAESLSRDPQNNLEVAGKRQIEAPENSMDTTSCSLVSGNILWEASGGGQ